jgi:hypothetical protein
MQTALTIKLDGPITPLQAEGSPYTHGLRSNLEGIWSGLYELDRVELVHPIHPVQVVMFSDGHRLEDVALAIVGRFAED